MSVEHEGRKLSSTAFPMPFYALCCNFQTPSSIELILLSRASIFVTRPQAKLAQAASYIYLTASTSAHGTTLHCTITRGKPGHPSQPQLQLQTDIRRHSRQPNDLSHPARGAHRSRQWQTRAARRAGRTPRPRLFFLLLARRRLHAKCRGPRRAALARLAHVLSAPSLPSSVSFSVCLGVRADGWWQINQSIGA